MLDICRIGQLRVEAVIDQVMKDDHHQGKDPQQLQIRLAFCFDVHDTDPPFAVLSAD